MRFPLLATSLLVLLITGLLAGLWIANRAAGRGILIFDRLPWLSETENEHRQESARALRDFFDRFEQLIAAHDEGLVDRERLGRLTLALAELPSSDNLTDRTPETLSALRHANAILIALERETG